MINSWNLLSPLAPLSARASSMVAATAQSRSWRLNDCACAGRLNDMAAKIVTEASRTYIRCPHLLVLWFREAGNLAKMPRGHQWWDGARLAHVNGDRQWRFDLRTVPGRRRHLAASRSCAAVMPAARAFARAW